MESKGKVKWTLASAADSLNSYSNRDRLLRLGCYGALLLSESPNLNRRGRQGLRMLSGRLGETRTVMRLMDDVPMLQYSISYGLGEDKDKDFFIRLLGILNNIADQETFRYLLLVRREEQLLAAAGTLTVLQANQISNRRWFYILSIIQASADMLNAVHWMPLGVGPWSGKLRTWQVGLCGTVSTLIGMYKSINYA